MNFIISGVVFSKAQSPDQKHQHHLEACQKYIPDLLNQKFGLSPTTYGWFFLIIYFTLFLAVLGLPRCVFSLVATRGPLFIAVQASHYGGFLVAEHRLWAHRFQQLWYSGSRMGLDAPWYGIFPDQGLNLCTLHWQADVPLGKSPAIYVLNSCSANSNAN